MSIAYGTACLWWDSAASARVDRTLAGDVVRCPHCGGPCDVVPDRESFMRMLLRFEITGHVGFREMMQGARGRCYRTRGEAWNAYRARPLVTLATA